MTDKPLILITNDDGIDSPGLHAAAAAVAELGELLIVAPSSQRTGAGRSYPPVTDKNIYPVELPLDGAHYTAFKADYSPAQLVIAAALKLAPRPIDLCISGINYGENLGSTVTSSGTVGAAIEAVSFDLPALAVSLETPHEFHTRYNAEIDFSTAAHFTRYFAEQILKRGLPSQVDLLKIDIPATATPQTPWRAGLLSRQRYWHPVLRPDREHDVGYQAIVDYDTLEPGSDIHIFLVERQVAVTPMTIDMSAPVAAAEVTKFLNGRQ
ncbi:MAG: 5'/3'-nucleotidase SurE [Chloroflexota bacterium]